MKKGSAAEELGRTVVTAQGAKMEILANPFFGGSTGNSKEPRPNGGHMAILPTTLACIIRDFEDKRSLLYYKHGD